MPSLLSDVVCAGLDAKGGQRTSAGGADAQQGRGECTAGGGARVCTDSCWLLEACCAVRGRVCTCICALT